MRNIVYNNFCQVFDGWELEGEKFPSLEDHPLSMAERFKMYCGNHSPRHVFVSAQNVALVQFHIPAAGEGFRVAVNFRQTPQRKSHFAQMLAIYTPPTTHKKLVWGTQLSVRLSM